MMLALLVVPIVGSLRRGHRRRSRRAQREEDRDALEMIEVAAHDLGRSPDITSAIALIAEHAVISTGSLGAYIERVESPAGEGDVEVIAVAGEGHPPLGTRIPYPGSLTEEIAQSGTVRLIDSVDELAEDIEPFLRESCPHCRGIVLPLTFKDGVLGALIVLREKGQDDFSGSEVRQLHSLGDLATAAFHRLLLIDRVRDSEERFRQITEHLDEVVWLGAPDLSVRYYVSPAYEKVFGHTLESFYQHPRSSVDLVHPDDRESVEEALSRLDTGDEYDIQYRIIRPDGEVRWIWSRAHPIRDQEGQIYRVAGIMEDITERKEKELELETRLRQLDALARLGQDALIETDLDELFETAVEIVEEGVGADLVELLRLSPDGKELVLSAGRGWEDGVVGHAVTSADQRSMAGYALLSAEPVISEDLRSETRFAGSDFLMRHGATSGLSVVIQGRTRPWGALGAHTRDLHRFSNDDIFFLQSVSNILSQAIELRRVEEERIRLLEGERTARAESEQQRDAFQVVSESRSRLMRGFSHDVKNPIGAADGFLQLLEEGVLGELSERQHEGVARARHAIGDALELIEDLLTIARAETGELQVESEPVDLIETVKLAIDSFEARAAMKGLSLEAEFPAEIRELRPTIYSDAHRIRQILGNLLSNAVKYTEEGGITVVLSLNTEGGEPPSSGGERGDEEDRPEPERWIEIAISDTGPGIPPEQERMIFSEFGRGGKGEEEEKGSQGIGLSISRRIAQALGGEITLESELGGGSTFTLWLPFDEAATTESARATRAA